MILAWLRGLLGRVPNPTRLLQDIWVFVLVVVTILLTVLALLFIVFPILDGSLSPNPQL